MIPNKQTGKYALSKDWKTLPKNLIVVSSNLCSVHEPKCNTNEKMQFSYHACIVNSLDDFVYMISTSVIFVFHNTINTIFYFWISFFNIAVQYIQLLSDVILSIRLVLILSRVHVHVLSINSNKGWVIEVYFSALYDKGIALTVIQIPVTFKHIVS